MIRNGFKSDTTPCFDHEKFGDLFLKMAFNDKERSQMSRICRRMIES
jgi:hypothetical protein